MPEIKLQSSGRFPNVMNENFLQMMVNRMIVGSVRHGLVEDARSGTDIQALKRIEKAIERYRATGNTEHLVDAANYCMIEFTKPSHPGAHFRHSDSRGYTRTIE